MAWWVPPLVLLALWAMYRGANHEDERLTKQLLSIPSQRQISAREASGRSSKADLAMATIPSQTFLMGNSESDSRTKAHEVTLESYEIQSLEVTNRQFARFVEATNFVSTAERNGESQVFDVASKAWRRVAGADWRHPEGPYSSIAGREDWPVVQVSWRDAAAFAAWAGMRLPTEAEWECAARGGRGADRYPWGPDERPNGLYAANYWQGWFPERDLGADGFTSVAPVGSFPANRNGARDMAGNVAEWCADWFDEEYYAISPRVGPRGPHNGSERVVRGGSWLSAENTGSEIEVADRQSARPETTTNALGFRCARSARQPSAPK